jgi:hypothetical protein
MGGGLYPPRHDAGAGPTGPPSTEHVSDETTKLPHVPSQLMLGPALPVAQAGFGLAIADSVICFVSTIDRFLQVPLNGVVDGLQSNRV